MAQSRVFYLCDGERENCKRNMCYKNGGDCKHTKDFRTVRNLRGMWRHLLNHF